MTEIEIKRPSLETAVLLLVFNRPEPTVKVFEQIRQVRPQRLYIAADGPRLGRDGDLEKVKKVREIVSLVDWPCSVKTLFRDENLGCKSAVSEGISWFFQCETEGIILEDDCLPHPDFFNFCEELLCCYADDERVALITGNNFQHGLNRGYATYYFSRYAHIWGWATWRRAWQLADMNMRFWPTWKRSSDWLAFWKDSVARKYWEGIFDKAYAGGIDTWDYPWLASVWYRQGLTATPNINLVSNIGFDSDATHTTVSDSPLAGLGAYALGPITHPVKIAPDEAADLYDFNHTFGGNNLRFPTSLFRLPRRLAAALYRRVRIRRSFCNITF